jgi:hypothetical protein
MDLLDLPCLEFHWKRDPGMRGLALGEMIQRTLTLPQRLSRRCAQKQNTGARAWNANLIFPPKTEALSGRARSRRWCPEISCLLPHFRSGWQQKNAFPDRYPRLRLRQAQCTSKSRLSLFCLGRKVPGGVMIVMVPSWFRSSATRDKIVDGNTTGPLDATLATCRQSEKP